eukprot:13963836-Alexandrium_andersonii.AAC.1
MSCQRFPHPYFTGSLHLHPHRRNTSSPSSTSDQPLESWLRSSAHPSVSALASVHMGDRVLASRVAIP